MSRNNRLTFIGGCYAMVFLMVIAFGCGKKSLMTDHSWGTPSDDAVTESEVMPSEESRFDSDMDKARPAPSASSESRPSSSGLKAGFSDDNKQYGYFLDFLKTYGHVAHQTLDVGERIILSVKDDQGKTLPNARVKVSASGKSLVRGKTLADGTFMFFPSMHDTNAAAYNVVIDCQGAQKQTTLDRNGLRRVDVSFDTSRQLPAPIPLDIVFILDTTGSMGEEILRLKQTIELINLNLSSVSPTPNIRFGMVLYKDRGDEYRTRVIPFTSDLKEFQSKLNTVSAGGGGDAPEDLEAALDEALNTLTWNENGIRLGFIITDAAPKYYPDQSFNYSRAAMVAKEKAIKLFTVGTGGLPINGEYVLRQISQFTSAAYIFLTYGEKGESDGGHPGSVSHHTGSNFQADKLEAIIIKFARNELAQLSDKPIPEQADYFQAVSQPGEEKQATLNTLFEKAVTQLSDYSSIELEPETPTAVLPLVSEKENALSCEYFTEHMMMALNSNSLFKHVARYADKQSVEDELALGLSGMVDESNASEVGRFIGAKLLITGKLYAEKGTYVLFFKLIRVETAEVLSVTKLVVDKQLGL